MRERIAHWAAGEEFVEAREIFGTTTFLYLGNFMAADDGGDLVVRLSLEDEGEALRINGAARWRTGAFGTPEYTKLPAHAVTSDEQLHAWLEKALTYSKTLEPKDRLLTKKVIIPAWKEES